MNLDKTPMAVSWSGGRKITTLPVGDGAGVVVIEHYAMVDGKLQLMSMGMKLVKGLGR